MFVSILKNKRQPIGEVILWQKENIDILLLGVKDPISSN